MTTILCEHCTAACCRYVALPIDKPAGARDYDDIRWYLMHERISVFVEDGVWYIQFQTRCKHVRPDNRCRIYDTRPKICEEYKAHDCDYATSDYGYDLFFTHPSQIERYYRDKTGRKLGALRRKQNGTGSLLGRRCPG